MNKKILAAVVGAAPVLGALAEEGTGAFNAGTAIITPAQNALTGILTSAGSAVAAVLLAGLAIWGGIAIVGLIKRSFNAGKGR